MKKIALIWWDLQVGHGFLFSHYLWRSDSQRIIVRINDNIFLQDIFFSVTHLVGVAAGTHNFFHSYITIYSRAN